MHFLDLRKIKLSKICILRGTFFITNFVQQTLNKTAVMTVKGFYPTLNVISLSCLHTDGSPADKQVSSAYCCRLVPKQSTEYLENSKTDGLCLLFHFSAAEILVFASKYMSHMKKFHTVHSLKY